MSTSTTVTPTPPSHSAEGLVIARAVSPNTKVRKSGGGSGRDSAGGVSAAAAVAEPLGRCIDACMRMLQAMLRSELTSPDNTLAASFLESTGGAAGVGGEENGFANSGGGGGGSFSGNNNRVGGSDYSDTAVHNQVAFLEGGFGDGFDLGGSGWKDGGGGGGGATLRAASSAGGVAQGEARVAGIAALATPTGVNATVVCLQECQSADLQRGLLGVLLKLRGERPGLLRRELLR